MDLHQKTSVQPTPSLTKAEHSPQPRRLRRWWEVLTITRVRHQFRLCNYGSTVVSLFSPNS